MKYFPLISIVVLAAIAIGNCTPAYGQESNDASACTDIIAKASAEAGLTDRIDGYYSGAQCYEKIFNMGLDGKDLDEAELAYAKAEVLGRQIAGNPTATKAKEGLEKLYRAAHNGLTKGIEKVYIRAEKSLSESEKQVFISDSESTGKN